MCTTPTPAPAGEPLPPAKRRRGRPRIFDEMRRHTLCAMISVGLSRNEACREVGVSPSSVVHAARTDAEFARRLQQALIDRANRPAELAHIGSRSWRPYARWLEVMSPHFRLPTARQQRRLSARRRLKRLIRSIVHSVLDERFPVAANFSHHSKADYCFKTPQDLRAGAVQKQ